MVLAGRGTRQMDAPIETIEDESLAAKLRAKGKSISGRAFLGAAALTALFYFVP